MQVLYIILGALAVLLPGLFIVSMFLPATVKVVRARIIPAAPAAVFEQVNVLRNWEKWSPWQQLDPGMQLTYNERESGEGAAFSWESRNRKVGKGQLMITASRPYEYIATDMQFAQQGTAKGYFRFEPAAQGTLVTWGLTAQPGLHPGRKLMGLMMDRWIGKDFERGLQNLKRLCSRF